MLLLASLLFFWLLLAAKMDRSLKTASPEETHAMGRRLGASLRPGDVVALIGLYGAGKTTFVKGVAAGMGLNPRKVVSPTFVLMHRYDGGSVPLFHFDCHRIADPAEILSLGLRDVAREGPVVLEWADQVATFLDPPLLEIRFGFTGESARELVFGTEDSRLAEIVHGLCDSASRPGE